MFKWPGAPSPRASKHELADYAELVCWRQGSTSTTNLSKDLGRLEENDYSDDGVPEDDDIDHSVGAAYTEIELRKHACRDGYPFVIDRQGHTLRASQDTENCKHMIYKYLLLATRLNMNDDRDHAGIDGAHLFECLAAEVGREYLGTRAESLVFGTASPGKFEDKVNNLCRHMKEGGRFSNNYSASMQVKDDKLDIVAWKHFSDQKPGKFIAFGQCKTGTNYRDTLSQLDPDSFCRSWLRFSPAFPPIRMSFVAEAVDRSSLHKMASDSGLLFDRCRIVDFCNCDNIDSNVLRKVATWTTAAAKAMFI